MDNRWPSPRAAVTPSARDIVSLRMVHSTSSAYHAPPAGSFSPARALILGHACSTNAGQWGEDVFASLDGWYTCIPYPTVVSLWNCGTPQLGPTFSTCAPPTSTVNIVFKRPTMSHQIYKESTLQRVRVRWLTAKDACHCPRNTMLGWRVFEIRLVSLRRSSEYSFSMVWA